MSSVKLIEYLEKRQIKCVIPISETIRQGVRNDYRKLVKGRYEDERYYRRMYKRGRYKVEQLFGNVKMAWGDRDRTRIYELARLFVMVRFILWNLMMLLKLSFSVFSYVHHRIVVVCLSNNFQTFSALLDRGFAYGL
ncbi:MAG: transposase [Aquificaceae bacterium]|nr:transposase [Aquificaceae bacterium]